jgi:hypothetical protein
MTASFKTPKLQKQLASGKAIESHFGDRAFYVSLRLDEIADVKSLAALERFPALECKPVGANRLGQWRLNVTIDLIMVFSLDHKPIPVDSNGTLELEKITGIRIDGFISLSKGIKR